MMPLPGLSSLSVHTNLWIEANGKVVLSRWRVQLLEAVDETGSISAAAERMRIQYRLAWERLEEMEEGLGIHLLDRHAGGAGGGGAQLTAAALELVARFNQLAAEVDTCRDEEFRQAFA